MPNRDTHRALPTACILAGGRGTRLGPLAEGIPKPMVEVGGRPFIDWPLGQLSAAGFRRVVLCIGHLGHVLRAHVGSGEAFGLEVAYSEDGPGLDGTLGAIRRAAHLLDDRIPVLYGDTYLSVDFADVVRDHDDHGAAATMTLWRNRDWLGTSNAVLQDGWVVEFDKAQPPTAAEWIDYGYAVYERSAITAFDGSDLADLSHALAATEALRGYLVSERFHEIGTPDALSETDQYLRGLSPDRRRHPESSNPGVGT